MEWLSDFLHSHLACRELDSSEWYPTRLLDVDSTASGDLIKLVLTVEGVSASRFNTLSHCWGTAEFLQLDQSTSTELEKGVHIDILPQAFKDAIHVSRRMGVQYLWIDSLCIRQDDPSDWMRESQVMHKVYSSAFCNISAIACTSSTQSLFRGRRPDTLRRIRIGIPSSSTKTPAGQYDLFKLGYYNEQLHDAPLNTRAWVLQERLLAKRVLHFTEHEVMWECATLTASESWPEGIPGRIRVRFKNITGKGSPTEPGEDR